MTEPATNRSHSWRVAAALLVLVAGVIGLFVWIQQSSGEHSVARHPGEEGPAVVFFEEDGWRYEFHLVSGTEHLFKLGAKGTGRAPKNVIDEHPDEARKLRRDLEEKAGVKDLEVLRGPYEADIKRLQRLGYVR